jgi:hypothetical protein
MKTEPQVKPQTGAPPVGSGDSLACGGREHDDGRYDTGCDEAFEFT